jgi:hypothetical protein
MGLVQLKPGVIREPLRNKCSAASPNKEVRWLMF